MTTRTRQQQLRYDRAYLDRASLAAEGSGPLVFTASSDQPNRYGFSLRTEGWRLDNYRANPVILWAHNASMPPIGRSDVDTDVVARRLTAAVTFDAEDEFAAAVESKYRRGFLSAVSVGFDTVDENGAPLAFWALSDEQIGTVAYYDLCEISTVPVPGDPGALKQQRRHALAGLGRELVELFDDQEDPGSDVSAEVLHAAVRAELTRLGIQLPADPSGPAADPPAGPAGIDTTAARAVLAAFTLEGAPRA